LRRAKLPAGIGIVARSLDDGANIQTRSWPGCGEIDVVENNGYYPYYVQGSIHSGSGATGYYYFSEYGGPPLPSLRFGLDGDSISWSVDGSCTKPKPIG